MFEPLSCGGISRRGSGFPPGHLIDFQIFRLHTHPPSWTRPQTAHPSASLSRVCCSLCLPPFPHCHSQPLPSPSLEGKSTPWASLVPSDRFIRCWSLLPSLYLMCPVNFGVCPKMRQARGAAVRLDIVFDGRGVPTNIDVATVARCLRTQPSCRQQMPGATWQDAWTKSKLSASQIATWCVEDLRHTRVSRDKVSTAMKVDEPHVASHDS